MPTPISDSFTDTAGVLLENHTPETGGAWSKHTSYASGSCAITAGGRLRNNAAQTACYVNATDPGNDNYNIQVDTYVMSLIADGIGQAGRINTGANTMYFARWNNNSNAWQLYKIVSGTATSLGSYSQTPQAGNNVTSILKLGTNSQILTVAGVDQITASDTAITARGKAGIREGTNASQTDSTGYHLNDYSVTTAGGTATNQALTATVNVSASMQRAVGTNLSATVNTSASVQKAVSKNLSATINTAASIQKAVGKNLSATVNVTASMTRAVAKALSATINTTASMARAVGKNLTANITVQAGIVKAVSKKLTANVTVTANLLALKCRLVVMVATVNVSASMSRSVSKNLTATVNVTSSIQKAVSKNLSATITVTGGIVKAVGKTLTATVSVSGMMSAVKAVAGTVGFLRSRFSAWVSRKTGEGKVQEKTGEGTVHEDSDEGETKLP